MARVYSALCIVGNRVAANTDDCYIEITVPVNVTIRVKRIHIDDGTGTATTLVDTALRVKFLETSTTMLDGSVFTPIKRNPTIAASACTVKTKTSSASTATPGTIVREFDRISMRTEHYFDWSARDTDDAITIKGASFFEIVVSTPSTSARAKSIHVLWEEF